MAIVIRSQKTESIGFVSALLCAGLIFFSWCSQLHATDYRHCDGKMKKLLHVIPHRMPASVFKSILKDAEKLGFCGIVIGIRSGIDLNSLKIASTVPVLSREFFMNAKLLASQHNLDIIPEFQFLTHQEHFLKQSIPSGMYNLTTYDPNSKDIRSVLENVLDEIVDLLDPVAVHIGHDEVAGINKYSKDNFLRPGELILPADLFIDSINHLYTYLKAKNVETWMWADMLIAHSEAPKMLSGNFHGDLDGYGANVRTKIPKDILLFDWHYKDQGPNFDSISVLIKSGFDVVGVVHSNQKNIELFSQSAMKQGAQGMMLTTWDAAREKNYGELERLMRIGGKAFKNN